jgi:hypothetical protein
MQIGNNIWTAIGLFGTCSMMLIALFATWPAIKASEKGRKFLTWYVFSVFLLPVAIVAAIVIKKPDEPRISQADKTPV